MSVTMGRGPHMIPLVFYDINIVVMRGYLYGIMLFNFKTGSINMVQLGNILLHTCYISWNISNIANKWKKILMNAEKTLVLLRKLT